MKALVFDSGALITLTMNGLLFLLPELKKSFKGKFLITQAVKEEIIDRPMHVQRFEFEALQIKDMLDKGILELPNSIGIQEEVIQEETSLLMDKANHFLQVKSQWIPIVSAGEMSCLALVDECQRKDIECIIAIDERTTRLLAEKPENLERLMSEKLHQRVKLVAPDFKIFSKYKFIRSSELIYVAYKKNLFPIKDKRVLEAALYATKFKGSSISFEEIEELKKL